jgi:hypothetical protein
MCTRSAAMDGEPRYAGFRDLDALEHILILSD